MFKSLGWPEKIILLLYHFLLFATPLYFSFRTEELFEFNKIILVYAISTLIGGFWLLRMILEKRLIFKRTYLDLPLLFFLVSQLASTIFSMHPRTSVLGYYSRFHGGLLSTLSYYVLYYAFVSNIPFKAIKKLLYTAVFSGIFVSAYGILEHFGHSTSCFLLSEGKSFGVDCWVQKVQERVFATFGQPNWLAAYAITLIPAGMYLAITEKDSLIRKATAAAASLLLFTALLFTQSRSGILGFAAGLAVFALGAALFSWKNSPVDTGFSAKYYLRRRVVQITLLFVAGFALISGVFGTPYTPSISESLSTAIEEEVTQETPSAANSLELGGTDSGEIRKIVWEGSLKVWERYPLIGSGLETFAYSYYQDRPAEHNLVSEWDFLYNKAHNEFLNFLATTGIFGLGAYLMVLGLFAFMAASQVLRKNSLLQLSLLAGVISLSVSNFFGFSTVMVTVLMFIFFAISSLERKKSQESPASLPSKNKNKAEFASGWQYGAGSLVVLIMLLLLSAIYNYRQADVVYSQGKALISSGRIAEGLESMQEAVERSPNEALFQDEMSEIYSSLAVSSAQNEQATASAEFASAAIRFSNRALELNPAHLNFYKTRARLFISLSQVDSSLLAFAKDSLNDAIERAPTDAKLWYNLGLVELGMENNGNAVAAMEKAVELKPDYESARLQLAKVYQAEGNVAGAREQYEYVLEYISPDNPDAINGLADLESN